MGARDDLNKILDRLAKKLKLTVRATLLGLLGISSIGILLLAGSLQCKCPNLILPLGVIGLLMAVSPILVLGVASSLYGEIGEKTSSSMVATVEGRMRRGWVVIGAGILLPAALVLIYHFFTQVVLGNLSGEDFIKHLYEYSFKPVFDFYCSLRRK